MIIRNALPRLVKALNRSPAAAILGPRQVGKTTLARQLADQVKRPIIYLDLQDERDRAKLGDPHAFFKNHPNTLVVFDEVQYTPELLRHLRPEIDRDRSKGRFLLLGSASFALLKQSAESLAGRLATVELGGLQAQEVCAGVPPLAQDHALHQLWLRGGFPESFTSLSDEDAYEWRLDFMRLVFERDLPQFGVTIAATSLQRLWKMLAINHGQVLNMSQLAGSMGLSSPTIHRYIDLLEAAHLIRRLQPLHSNLGKRLVKSPKVYLRDSGLLHALLGIVQADDLLAHPIRGSSWEGMVLDHIVQSAPSGAEVNFYRTAAGAEMDVVVSVGNKRLCFEAKAASAPKVSQGFHHAQADVDATSTFIVAPVNTAYAFSDTVQVIPMTDVAKHLNASTA
ncbi:MAG: hypothetical protein RLZZ502_1154 [Pseudomonadota bacterium]